MSDDEEVLDSYRADGELVARAEEEDEAGMEDDLMREDEALQGAVEVLRQSAQAIAHARG